MDEIQTYRSIVRTFEALEDSLPLLGRYLRMEHVLAAAYKHRKNNEILRDLCECMAWKCLDEFPKVRHEEYWTDHAPLAFPKLATILCERGEFAQAINICQKALSWGISDGTKSGFWGRIERINQAKLTCSEPQSSTTDCDLSSYAERIPAILENLHNQYANVTITRSVPEYPGMDGNTKLMTSEQRRFYTNWLESWEKGKALPLEGQTNYVFAYIHEQVLNQPPMIAIEELGKLKRAYSNNESNEKSLRYYCARYVSDLFLLQGDYRKALRACPQMPLDSLLQLRLVLGGRLTGKEILRLSGVSNLTVFGKENIREIERIAQRIFKEYEIEHHCSIIATWFAQQNMQGVKYRVFTISSQHFQEIDLFPGYCPQDNACENELTDLGAFFGDIIRDAENQLREERGLPRIGEGWIQETELLYKIKDAFPNYNVQQHFSPVWLGRQHLDIFITEVNIAIEFQGPQHDEPIEFFGGDEAFIRRQELDERKRLLCLQNGVKLIYVRPGYDFEDIRSEIKSSD